MKSKVITIDDLLDVMTDSYKAHKAAGTEHSLCVEISFRKAEDLIYKLKHERMRKCAAEGLECVRTVLSKLEDV